MTMIENPQAVPAPTAKKVKKPRRPRPNLNKYPYGIRFNAGAAMAKSLSRVCPEQGPMNESTYLRLVLHRALLADDPVYREQMSNGVNHNG